MLTRLKHWFRFNRMYVQGKIPWDTGITPPELHTFVQTHPAGRALDLGCGTGTNAIFLAQHGWQVQGIDFAVKAITQAKRKAQQANVAVDFRIGDVTYLPNTDPFDLILDIGCFHGLDEAKRLAYANNAKRLLTPDGSLLLYVHFKNQQMAARMGIYPQALSVFEPELQLIHRQDGVDTSRPSPSAWLTYRHTPT